MRARRWHWTPLVAAVLLAGCTQATNGSHGAGAGAAPGQAAPAPKPAVDLIVGNEGPGVAALVSDPGSVLFQGPAVPALGDWSELYTASHVGNHTVVQATPLSSDGVTGAGRVRGDLTIKTVSFDGTRVALGAPTPRGADPWIPHPRSMTKIVVANPTGIDETQRFLLEGNFEPEAFSTDNQFLYMIKYLPATDPAAYRVVALDLLDDDGDVYPVSGRDKSWNPKMAGTRLQQVPSPFGDMLYTLYTSQPPSYARGYDGAQAAAGRPVAFVHTLNLADHWAVCVGLPKALWGGRSVDEALALAPNGRNLYVVDAARGFVADMETSRPLGTRGPKVVRSTRLKLGLPRTGQLHAVVAPDNHTLTVARARDIVTVNTRSFEVVDRTTVPARVSGLGWSDDGKRLYVLTPGSVRVVDPTTGSELRRIPAGGMDGIDYVGSIDE
jgi:hypothetical protein